MAKTKPKTYHHGDLRNALIQAGLNILSNDGVAALTLREVARRAGVSHSAPYAHFADKDALLGAIAEQGFELLAEETARAETKRSSDPTVTLAESAWAYVRFAIEHPEHMRLMFSGLASRIETERSALDSSAKSTLAVLEGAIQSAQASGELKREPAPLMVLTAWALAHGLATLMIEDQLAGVLSDSSPEKLTRACAELLLDGMRKR